MKIVRMLIDSLIASGCIILNQPCSWDFSWFEWISRCGAGDLG